MKGRGRDLAGVCWSVFKLSVSSLRRRRVDWKGGIWRLDRAIEFPLAGTRVPDGDVLCT